MTINQFFLDCFMLSALAITFFTKNFTLDQSLLSKAGLLFSIHFKQANLPGSLFFLIKFPRWAKTASFSLASHSWWRVLFLIPLETKNSTQKEEFRFASYKLPCKVRGLNYVCIMGYRKHVFRLKKGYICLSKVELLTLKKSLIFSGRSPYSFLVE